MASRMDCYERLGIEPTADADAIDRAYQQLLLELYIDRDPRDRGVEAAFNAVNAAYHILGDPQARAAYDHLRFGPSRRTVAGFRSASFSGLSLDGYRDALRGDVDALLQQARDSVEQVRRDVDARRQQARASIDQVRRDMDAARERIYAEVERIRKEARGYRPVERGGTVSSMHDRIERELGRDPRGGRRSLATLLSGWRLRR